MSEQAGFWAIVEIMGHNVYAGLVTEELVAGTPLVRVDVPATSEQKGFSKLFGGAAIYSITPVEEDVARAMASKFEKRPLDVWDLPTEWRKKIHQPAIAGPVDDDDEDEECGQF